MKKLLLLIFAIALSTQMAFSAPWPGYGSSSDPFQVSTLSQLQSIDGYPSSNRYWILMNDIDASATSTWNSGAGFNPINANFYGRFDGQNYTISNLYINRPTSNDVGLFSITWNARIKNVTISNPTIVGLDYVGVIGQIKSGTIVSNVKVINADITGRDIVGGMIGGHGYGTNTVKDCSISGEVSGDDYVGGFIGRNYRVNIQRCYSTADVSGDEHIGGFAGHSVNSPTYFTDCYSRGDVSGDYRVGGFVGSHSASTITNNCYSTGSVSGNSSVGGFCAYRQSGSSITDCFWDTQSSGQATSSGGTGKTTSEMMQETTFTNWDFTNVWSIAETADYPNLDGYDSIPTLTEWAAIFMGVLLAGFGVFFIFRRMG